MFEKEAEEYADSNNIIISCDCNYYESKDDLKEAYLAGAEFGYNKAKVEVEDSYRESLCNSELNLASVTEQLEELEKANEWHYPSKGEHPKVETWVIGFYYGKDNWHKVFYKADGSWWGEGQLCQPPFAWKEIVPPKTEVSE